MYSVSAAYLTVSVQFLPEPLKVTVSSPHCRLFHSEYRQIRLQTQGQGWVQVLIFLYKILIVMLKLPG